MKTPANPALMQFQMPRGRWASACLLARHAVLHPRNAWTAGNAAIAQERRA